VGLHLAIAESAPYAERIRTTFLDPPKQERNFKMTHAWILEPAAALDDGVWQGRPLMTVAVQASSAAFARITADRWASIQTYCDSRRPGFEDQLLYHAREAEIDLNFDEGDVLLLAGPSASTGPQNERPKSSGLKHTSPEGKTTTTGASDAGDFPGNAVEPTK
jgi:hypothetical protein